MKKKIIITLAVFSLLSVIGGIYIIFTIRSATSTLDTLITLHQVEIIREQLLLKIKSVQSDISYRNTRYARNIDTIVDNVIALERGGETCFECHHSPETLKQLIDLKNEIQDYADNISKIFTYSARADRLQREEDTAYAVGESLLITVNNMIILASGKLEQKTQSSLRNIDRSNNILFALLMLGPVTITLISIFFMKNLTRPIGILQNATRKLKDGDLDHRIKGLKDEFGEVADSFNDMAISLKEQTLNIQESEKRYRTLFESAGDAIIIFSAEPNTAGKILSANRAAASMYGYTIEELHTLNVRDLYAPASFKYFDIRLEHILSGDWIMTETSHLRKDGTSFPVELHSGLLELKNKKNVLIFSRDITTRIEFENALRESEERFRALAETTSEWIWEVNEHLIYTYVSPKVQDILGYEPDEVLGRSLFNLIPAEETERISDLFSTLIRSRKSFEQLEYACMNKTGRSVVLETSGVPFFDSDGVFRGYRGVDRDVTERKKIQESLQRAEQMKIVGEWAAGLVHEIKNPLAGIKGAVELLMEDLPLTERDKDIMNSTLYEIQRIESLLKSLLDYARPSKPDFHTVRINEILDHTLAMMSRHPYLSPGKSQIELLKYLDMDLPDIKADPQQLQQVFINLLSNSLESMQNGGVLTVRSSCEASTGSVLIDISDTGMGIEDEIMEKIFQPFFTTKTKGTGLGLAITKRIIDIHGGTIHAENIADGGALFRITLPAIHNKEKATA